MITKCATLWQMTHNKGTFCNNTKQLDWFVSDVSRRIIGFSTRQMPLVDEELLTFLEHLSSKPFLCSVFSFLCRAFVDVCLSLSFCHFEIWLLITHVVSSTFLKDPGEFWHHQLVTSEDVNAHFLFLFTLRIN